MSALWDWMVSCFYALIIAIVIILIVTLLLALVAWATGCGKKKKRHGGCGKPDCAPLCPVYLRNPHPDDRVFQLARVDGSANGSDNACSTGSFTIQRINSGELLYTVTMPANTFITDIYTLEVACERDFPLTPDGCAVDLTQFHHQTYPCEETSNVQTFTSTLSLGCNQSPIFVSILVVFSDSEICDPLQMMTLSGNGTQPITLTGNCITPPCPPESCCDPIVPNFIKLKLPRCRLDSSSSNTQSTNITSSAATTTEATNSAEQIPQQQQQQQPQSLPSEQEASPIVPATQPTPSIQNAQNAQNASPTPSPTV